MRLIHLICNECVNLFHDLNHLHSTSTGSHSHKDAADFNEFEVFSKKQAPFP